MPRTNIDARKAAIPQSRLGSSVGLVAFGHEHADISHVGVGEGLELIDAVALGEAAARGVDAAPAQVNG